MPISDNMRGVLYMNIAMLAFTVNDSFMKAITQDVPLFQAILVRGGLTVAVLALIAVWTVGGLNIRTARRDAGVLAIRTIAEVGGTVFFLQALVHMPLANLTAIMQSLPLVVPLTAAVVFGDKIGWRRLLAICIGFAGVLLIIKPGTTGFDVWSMFGLGSVACVVVRDLATRELSRDVPSVAVALWAAIAVTVMGAGGVAVQGWQPITSYQALMLTGASAALIVGYMFIVMVMRVGDIGFVAPFRYMALLWAILFGWVLFGSLPDGWTILGAAIVVATGIYTLWRERKLHRQSAAGA